MNFRKLLMIKTTRLIAAFIIVTFTCFALVNNVASPFKRRYQENHAPVVKIIKPKTDSTFAVNSLVAYNITVADKEDGDSRYDELNTKEVLLQVKYVADKPSTLLHGVSGPVTDEPGLAMMRTNNCFNCHGFNSKVIGPSFYDIAQKYAANQANITLVAKRVKDGSVGVWGKVPMPTHPELTLQQAQTIVEWLMHNATDAETGYYVGTAGTFKLKAPVKASPNGGYLLTASYIDHSLKTDSTKPRLQGSDAVFVRVK